MNFFYTIPYQKLFEENSYPAIEPTDIRCDQVRNYARRIMELITQEEELVKQMVAMSEARKEYLVLHSIPGIGMNDRAAS